MEDELRVCSRCRVLVQPSGPDSWRHVPELAAKFTRLVCDEPAPGKVPSGSERRFGLGRSKTPARDKLVIRGETPQLADPREPIIVAADGSYRLHIDGDKVRKPMSWAYISTAGRYGLGTSFARGTITGGSPLNDGSGRDKQRSLQAELRALAHALQSVPAEQRVLLLSDSRDALDLVTLWKQGHQVMPGGYNLERAGGAESTLGRFARLAHQNADRIDLQWVRGHSGHALQEGADSLARRARAWATDRADRESTARAADQIAYGALANFRVRSTAA